VTAVAQPPQPQGEHGSYTQPQDPTKPGGIPIPPDIRDRVKRGKVAARKDANLRRLCQKFWQGEHYWYQNVQGALRVLSTALIDVTGGKPGHRVRNTYNFIQQIVEGKVSASTGTTPGYEIDPSSADLEDVAAARIAEQVAYYGYDKWWLRRARKKVYTTAFVQREGFAMPYFDACVGPYLPGPGGELQGLGEIRVETFNRSEVLWEPGVDFMDSPWHAVERAVLVEKIGQLPGYIGGLLAKDATTADLPSEKASDQMAVLTDYMERPCQKYPNGRRCFIAGGRIVVDFSQTDGAPEGADWWESYPYMDAHGVVCDEPCIHRLSYTVNPEGDDLGLVERLIDLTRTIDDCWNKLLEWKNRCLMPRIMAPAGSNIRTNDVPGGVDYYKVDPINPTVTPQWEKSPPIPQELFQMLNLALDQLRALANDFDVQPDPNVAAKTVTAAAQQAQSHWDGFLGDAAEFDSRLMRHCLTLVARFYTEERLLPIRGRHGWEPSRTFRGMDLRSQANVRVSKTSLETKGRAQTMQEIQFVQANWPGYITAEAALAALHGGSGENLGRGYQLDVATAWDVVQRLRGGPDAAAAFGWRQDMDFGDPALGFMVPGWTPRRVDNIAVWKQVVGDSMKEDSYRQLPPETQHLFEMVFAQLEHQEQQRKLQVVAQEQGMAAQLGGMNAARPQLPAPLAQQGPLSAEQAAPTALTPRQ
jgi:hypothetical protein